MDESDISRRYDALELDSVDLEASYAAIRAQVLKSGRDPHETAELLRQAVNSLQLERELSRKLFALLSDVMVGWVEDARHDRPS